MPGIRITGWLAGIAVVAVLCGIAVAIGGGSAKASGDSRPALRTIPISPVHYGWQLPGIRSANRNSLNWSANALTGIFGRIHAVVQEGNEMQLPELMVTQDGTPVKSVSQWRQTRRGEILELFRKHVYGRTPDGPFKMSSEVFEEDPRALGGIALRRQVALTISTAAGKIRIDVLMYLPAAAKQPVPVFLLLNFGGNHTVLPDPAIALARGWVQKRYSPPEQYRGARHDTHPVGSIIERGYGMVTAYCGDIDPDYDDGFKNGVHPLFDAPGERPADAWGAVGAWAWGLSRVMDYLETVPAVDSSRVAVLGHSRLGKAALWAGAQDERFSVVISNDSGCTGASLARHPKVKAESVQAINESFPHWFAANYKAYNGRENDLPVDQHMLIALIAPRPVYVASASEDAWSDQEGEFLAAVHAAPAYELYGLKGLSATRMPPVNTPIQDGHIGYHLREGGHALLIYDWERYMDFAERHWKGAHPAPK